MSANLLGLLPIGRLQKKILRIAVRLLKMDKYLLFFSLDLVVAVHNRRSCDCSTMVCAYNLALFQLPVIRTCSVRQRSCRQICCFLPWAQDNTAEDIETVTAVSLSLLQSKYDKDQHNVILLERKGVEGVRRQKAIRFKSSIAEVAFVSTFFYPLC